MVMGIVLLMVIVSVILGGWVMCVVMLMMVWLGCMVRCGNTS